MKVFPRTGLIALLLLASVHAYGQTEKPAIIDVSVNMLTWVKHLHSNFDKYFSQEKGPDLKQQFGLFKQDLASYMKTRKVLSDSLFRHNIAPGTKDPDNLELLKTKMSTMMEHMRSIADLSNPALREEGDKLNNEIYDVLYGTQTRYLSKTEAFLGGVSIEKKDLAIDNSISYPRLEECVHLISSIEDKIDKKIGK